MNEPIDFEWLETEAEFANILRWEDDGGQTCESILPEINMPVTIEGIDNAQIPPTVILSMLMEIRRNPMIKRVGLWLDLNKAVIVSITDDGEEIKRISSDMEHYVRYSTSVPGDGSPEETRDRRFWTHLNEYFDKVVTHIGDAKAIQIFGPGEAKFTLKNQLELKGLLPNVVSIDEIDILTDRQILTKVKARFPIRALFDLSNS